MKKTAVKKKKEPLHKTLTRKDWWEVIDTGFALEMYPGLNQGPERLAYTFLQWCENPENLVIENFLFEYRMTWMAWEYQCKKHPIVAKAYALGKRKIAANRMDGSMKRRLSYEPCLLGLGELDSDYKIALEYAADLKKKGQAEQTGDKVYVLTNDPQVIKRDSDEKTS